MVITATPKRPAASTPGTRPMVISAAPQRAPQRTAPQPGPAPQRQDDALAAEVREIREITDLLAVKVQQRIAKLEEREAALDAKIAKLEQLLRRADEIVIVEPVDESGRPREIMALRQRGMQPGEIADVLRMPAGEVELMLNLHGRHGGTQFPHAERSSGIARKQHDLRPAAATGTR